MNDTNTKLNDRNDPLIDEIMQIISAKPEHISSQMDALINVACAETRSRVLAREQTSRGSSTIE